MTMATLSALLLSHLLVASLAFSSIQTHFTLHIDDATLLTSGSVTLPPMTSVPCSGPLQEIVKPPNVDTLYDWYINTRKTPDADPSWGVLWPTAVSLTQYLMDNPATVENKRVVELGCGLALCGLVSTTLGAKSVIISDREPYALHCALSTAAVNSITTLQALMIDWTNVESSIEADVVLASDVLYDKETIEAFAQVCQNICGRGGVVLVADPTKERVGGARELFRTAMQNAKSFEMTDLAMIECHDEGKTMDSKDHMLRMREPTVLIKCIL